jgi:F0F1-type ATP synthase assembly protein I
MIFTTFLALIAGIFIFSASAGCDDPADDDDSSAADDDDSSGDDDDSAE